MIHADGATLNTTEAHRWAIHSTPPGKDFYDWQNRCISTNQVYNPYKVGVTFPIRSIFEFYFTF